MTNSLSYMETLKSSETIRDRGEPNAQVTVPEIKKG